MKKFKNIKLMLIGLFAMVGMNAFAFDGDHKTDGTGWYYVENEAKGEVTFCGYSIAQADPTAVKIEATVELPDDDGVSKKTYKVVQASPSWWKGTDAPTGKARNLSSSDLQSLEFEFRTDWDADMLLDGSGVNRSYDAVYAFKSTLKKVVIKNAHKVYTLPLMTGFAKLEEVDFSGISNDGAGVTVIANFLANTTTLKTVKLPSNEPLDIKANAFDRIQGTDASGKPTAVTGIDISNATSIGCEAFRGAYITSVTIGENVSSIDPYAFVADSYPTNAYLEEVVWKSSKVMGGDPVVPHVKAVFPGQVNIKKVTVEAAKVQFIESGAFTGITANDFELDLSKAPVLKTIAGGIPNVAYKTLKLQGTALEGDNLDTMLGFALANKSKGSLVTLTLPDGLTALQTDEFKDYNKLSDITINMKKVPANAFKDCATLATLTLGAKVEEIGANAFDGTSLTAITIPAGVKKIEAGAFARIAPTETKDGKTYHKAIALDMSAATSLGSLGDGVFEDTNISPKADFSNTAVTVIPANAFAKGGAFALADDKFFLEEVVLKEGSASSKVSIGNNAFKNNEGLEKVTNLNQANYDFDGKTKFGIGTCAFQNTALTAVELDQTPITYVADQAFAEIETLKSVKLNAETTVIGVQAFEKDWSLTTVDNLNQAKLTTISNKAFAESAIATLDLSAATSLTTIGAEAFSAGKKFDGKVWKYNAALTTITLPAEDADLDPASKDLEFAKKYKNQITSIGEGAFLWQKNLTKFENFQYTKISTLPQMFSNNKAADINLKADATGFDDQTPKCPAGLTLVLPNVTFEVVEGKDWDEYKYNVFAWESSDATIRLTTIDNYALQGLGLVDIVIPATVTTFGGCVLQGNTNLKNVVWMDAKPSSTKLNAYTFRGDSNLEKFFYMTTGALKSGDLTDMHFYWCSKDKLRVYVTKESLKVLEADGYTTANAKYSKLNDELIDMITFSAFNTADNMYYRTYYNDAYSTWIKASDDVKVYTAQFNGAQVEMVEADIEGGYYKMEALTYGSNEAKAVAIVACANKEVEVEYYALAGNNKSTLKDKYNEMKVVDPSLYPDGIPASKLSYFFKLGKGPKGIGFYRITTGTFKAGAVYLKAADAARMADFYPLAGEETAIKAIEQMVEDDAPVYNLQGVRVNAAQKGMFIKNGKKFIVK